MCHEERLLYRTISGLHTSISTQLSEHYGLTPNKTTPNLNLFFEKVGNHPERIENLYFAYTVLLRAIKRAEGYIKNFTITTGNETSDNLSKALVNEMYQHISNQDCDYPFKDYELFSDISKVISSLYTY